MNHNQSYPRVIVFFGPDGAGKTTHARHVIRDLRFHKRRTKWAWLRGRHSLAFFLAEFFTKHGYFTLLTAPNGVSFKVFDPKLFPNFQRFWEVVEFVSVLPWIILRVHLPRILGYTVVAERYVVDTVVYLSYWLGRDFLQHFTTKILLSFIPKDSLLFHMDAQTQLLLERARNDTVTTDYIEFQREVYCILAKTLSATTIDTSKYTVSEAIQIIHERLTQELTN